MSYGKAIEKYQWTDAMDEEFTRLTRAADFDLLDYEIMEVEHKPTAEQVEEILTAYNYSIAGDDLYFNVRDEHMRAAIRKVMGGEYFNV